MQEDFLTNEYNLKCTVKNIKITALQERLGKEKKETMESNLVCLVPEMNGQFTKWLDDHVFQNAHDVMDTVEDDLSIESIAIISHPIHKAVRLAYCAGRKEIQSRHFVLMTEDLEDQFKLLNDQVLLINIRPAQELDIHGV